MNKPEEQILKELAAEFIDEDALMQVPGPGGKTFDYIKVHYVVKRLNEVLGIDWSAETIGEPIIHQDPRNEEDWWVTVGVRLTIYFDDNKIRCRDGWDSVLVKTYGSGPKKGQFIDLGNNIKQSWSQSLKVAASKFGVGAYLYFGGVMPDDEFNYAEEEKVEEVKYEKKEKIIPEKPEWGGSEPVFDTPQAKKGYSSNKKAADDFFNAPKGKGVGFSKGSSSVSASAELGQTPVSKPNVFSLNAVLNGFKDMISAGLIETKPLEEMIAEITGIEGIDDIHKLTQEEAHEIIQNQKKILRNR